MLNHLNRQIFEAGTLIFNEGDEGNCAYLIESGTVEIIATVNGLPQRVNIIGSHELFGEVALIDHQPRTATARAQEKVVLILIQRSMVNELLEKTDPIVRHLLLVILERYRSKSSALQASSAQQKTEHVAMSSKHKAIRGEATEKLTLAHDILHALSNDEFQLFYQPICELSTGHVAGYEALIRWHHPTQGLVSPMDFLWLAEQTGQIRELGLWTLRRACRDWPALRRSISLAKPFVSVNMSPSQLTGSDFVAQVKAILSEFAMPSSELKLELTETVMINNPQLAFDVLSQLTQFGSQLAIDDFGTGHSSLQTLHRYPIGTLKIDLSFTRTMLTSAQSREIVNSSIQLAHSLNMDVVAEGIEEEVERAHLLKLNCNFGQGWLFGRATELKNIIGQS